MKKIISIILLSLLVTSPALAGISADITKIGVGARSMGMGGAGVALQGDQNSLFLNPAGMAWNKKVSVSTMYTSLLGDISYNQATVIYPLEVGVLGVGYIGASLGDSYVTQDNSGTTAINTSVSAMSYQDRMLLISYAKDLGRQLAIGSNLKIIEKTLSGGTIANGKGTGYNLDLGFIYKLTDFMMLGLNQQNLINSSLISWGSGATDKLRSITKLGATTQVLDNLKVGTDLDLNLYNLGSPSVLHLGAEWQPVKFLTLRGGIDNSNLTMGVGLKYAGFDFNYAYHQYENLGELTTHYFSLSFLMD